MSDDKSTVLLAAVLDSLTLLRGQIDTVQDRLDGIEDRLNSIDSGQAGLTDIEPALEIILAKQIESEKSVRGQLATLSRLTAFTHAAATGAPTQLPADLLADPSLERFRREMPAERHSPDRSLERWRDVSAKLSTLDLAVILTQQFQPSPTETVDDLALRYRMAAVSREELRRRYVAVPEFPARPVERDRSSEATAKRAAQLAALWRAGPSPRLYGEAELAGAVDVFEQLEEGEGITRAMIEKMHQKMGDHIAEGQRLTPRLRSAFGDDDPTVERDGPKR